MPSMWPFGIAGPNSRVGPGASRTLPRAFFPRKEEEKEGQGRMARLLISAGRAGTSVWFYVTASQGSFKIAVQKLYLLDLFCEPLNYWENSPCRMDYTSDAISQFVKRVSRRQKAGYEGMGVHSSFLVLGSATSKHTVILNTGWQNKNKGKPGGGRPSPCLSLFFSFAQVSFR